MLEGTVTELEIPSSERSFVEPDFVREKLDSKVNGIITVIGDEDSCLIRIHSSDTRDEVVRSVKAALPFIGFVVFTGDFDEEVRKKESDFYEY